MEQKFFNVSFDKTGTRERRPKLAFFVGSSQDLLFCPMPFTNFWVSLLVSTTGMSSTLIRKMMKLFLQVGEEFYDVISSDDGNEFVTLRHVFVPAETAECSLSISLLTRQCSIVLVDLGGGGGGGGATL